MIVNLADVRAARSRAATLALVHDGPDEIVSVIRRYGAEGAVQRLQPWQQSLEWSPSPVAPVPRLQLPQHHDVRASDVLLRRLHATLAAAAQRGPVDFADLLLSHGVGARTVSALAFVAELVHGAPSRFSDPARYSLAHGGKDGHPFPVDLRVYDHTIHALKRAVTAAKLGHTETLAALERLDRQARAIEGKVRGPS